MQGRRATTPDRTAFPSSSRPSADTQSRSLGASPTLPSSLHLHILTSPLDDPPSGPYYPTPASILPHERSRVPGPPAAPRHGGLGAPVVHDTSLVLPPLTGISWQEQPAHWHPSERQHPQPRPGALHQPAASAPVPQSYTALSLCPAVFPSSPATWNGSRSLSPSHFPDDQEARRRTTSQPRAYVRSHPYPTHHRPSLHIQTSVQPPSPPSLHASQRRSAVRPSPARRVSDRQTYLPLRTSSPESVGDGSPSPVVRRPASYSSQSAHSARSIHSRGSSRSLPHSALSLHAPTPIRVAAPPISEYSAGSISAPSTTVGTHLDVPSADTPQSRLWEHPHSFPLSLRPTLPPASHSAPAPWQQQVRTHYAAPSEPPFTRRYTMPPEEELPPEVAGPVPSSAEQMYAGEQRYESWRPGPPPYEEGQPDEPHRKQRVRLEQGEHINVSPPDSPTIVVLPASRKRKLGRSEPQQKEGSVTERREDTPSLVRERRPLPRRHKPSSGAGRESWLEEQEPGYQAHGGYGDMPMGYLVDGQPPFAIRLSDIEGGAAVSPPGRLPSINEGFQSTVPPVFPGEVLWRKHRLQGPDRPLPGHLRNKSPEDVAEERSTKVRKFDKVPIACYFCRNRKLKCDGQKPECTNCSTRKDVCCSYADKPRRRGAGKNPKGTKAKKVKIQLPKSKGPPMLDPNEPPPKFAPSNMPETAPRYPGLRRKTGVTEGGMMLTDAEIELSTKTLSSSPSSAVERQAGAIQLVPVTAHSRSHVVSRNSSPKSRRLDASEVVDVDVADPDPPPTFTKGERTGNKYVDVRTSARGE